MNNNNFPNNNTKHRATGFRIKYINTLFIVVILLACAALLGVLLSISEEYNNSVDVTDDYQSLDKNALIVIDTSDYLTRSVQNFVITGETEYLNDYFTEANETKSREKAIENIKKISSAESIVGILEEAVAESKNLMNLEYSAMRYAAEGYGLDISELPDEVKSVVLPPDASKMTDEEKIEKANQIVFGEEYNEYKERIYASEQKFTETAIAHMETLKEEGRSQLKKEIMIQYQMMFLIALISTLLFLTILNLIVDPLKNAVDCISKGTAISPITGSYEIIYMSEEYNEFHKTKARLQRQLKADAEKDDLTGLVNGNGYNMVINRLSKEKLPMALLVIGIDGFETMARHEGDPAADEILKEVGAILSESFRGNDIVSRVENDVFTVIMSNITPKYKGTISNKIAQINEELQDAGVTVKPDLTISAGCSFSLVGYHDHLYTMAASLMQKAKASGGSQIIFE